MRIFNLIITTNKELKKLTDDVYRQGLKDANEIDVKSTWSAIYPVIHDLEKMRTTTCDQDKITHIQQWLRENFEVRDEQP